MIWVYLNVSPETVLKRLHARREKNGETETSDKTKNGVLNFRRRAEKMWKFIKENYAREPYTLIEVPEGPSPADIYELLQPIARTMASPTNTGSQTIISAGNALMIAGRSNNEQAKTV